jgi:hypothetical protein
MAISTAETLPFEILPTKRCKTGMELVFLLMALPSEHSISHHSSSSVFRRNLYGKFSLSQRKTLEFPRKPSASSPRLQYTVFLKSQIRRLKGTCGFQA